jgi:hypothetical protein
MWFNALQLYLKGLVNFFTFLELSTSLHELNIHFKLIEIIIQMLYIALINIY